MKPSWFAFDSTNHHVLRKNLQLNLVVLSVIVIVMGTSIVQMIRFDADLLTYLTIALALVGGIPLAVQTPRTYRKYKRCAAEARYDP